VDVNLADRLEEKCAEFVGAYDGQAEDFILPRIILAGRRHGYLAAGFLYGLTEGCQLGVGFGEQDFEVRQIRMEQEKPRAVNSVVLMTSATGSQDSGTLGLQRRYPTGDKVTMSSRRREGIIGLVKREESIRDRGGGGLDQLVCSVGHVIWIP
jgi:hypothetical protein